MFGPSSKSVNLVKYWLPNSGIGGAKQSSNQGWIDFDASIQQLEDLLVTTFYQYRNDRTGESTYGCSQYLLPTQVAPHVDYVLPGVQPFLRSKRKPERRDLQQKRGLQPLHRGPWKQPFAPHPHHWPHHRHGIPEELPNCGYNTTPPYLQALYHTPKPVRVVGDHQVGIYERGAYAEEDLEDFFRKYAPEIPSSTHPYLVSINGGMAPGPQDRADVEADLDLQFAHGLLGPANVTLYQSQIPENYTADVPLISDLLDALHGSFCDAEQRKGGFMCGGDSLTSVLSVSADEAELFGESAAYQRKAYHEFMKLGLQGKTIIFSSGNYGVAVNPIFGYPPCEVNGCVPQDLNENTTPYIVNNGTIFMPGFPSNGPYVLSVVLSVGATRLEPNQTVFDHEEAMNLSKVALSSCNRGAPFSSSGGFANYFDRPKYQDDAVSEYFSNFNPPYPSYDSNKLDVTNNATNIGNNGGIYNRLDRGIPDVSANRVHFLSFNIGEEKPTSGTNVSAPIWGAIVAMIKAKRAEIGKAPVGFINTVLYEHPEVFHDIRSGNNPGCGTAGFEAVKGWDLVTGLGTPNYPALEELFLSLP